MISCKMIEREKYCNKGKAGLSRPSGTKPKAKIRDNQQDIFFLPTLQNNIIGKNIYFSYNIRAKNTQTAEHNKQPNDSYWIEQFFEDSRTNPS